MIGKNKRKKERLKYLQELARQSILKYAPEPITAQELHDHQWLHIMRDLIATVSHARYFKPSQVLTEINKIKLTTKPLQTTIISCK